MKHLLEKNLNPVISVGNEGTVLYSNNAGEPLLKEWGIKIGEKLPSSIADTVQKVITQNNPEKMEVKAGIRVYLIVFHPLPEQGCVNISGFDISAQKELEDKLRERENKYRNIVETSVEGIWIFNSVSETTYVNEKMAEMLGYSPEEMIGRFIWDFAYEEDKGIFQVKLANRKQGIDEIYELKLIRKDGSPLWVSISAKGFFDDGKFAGSVGMFTDITESKKVEEALRESEERFRSAFYDSAVAMALVDPDARLMKVNDAFCRLLGFEKSEMEGSTFLNFTYLDDLEPSIKTHKAVINRDKPFFWLEKRYIRKDGQVIWCEVSSSPVFNSKGCPIYTIAHIQDINERKRAEEALKKAHDNLEEKVKERTTELEKTYKSLIESEKGLSEAQKMAHIGNWVWDIATDKAYWSEEMYRIFGRDPQKLAPSINEFYNYIHSDDRQDIVNLDNKALDEKSSICKEFRILLDDGGERRVYMQSEIIFDEKNVPIRIKGIVQDITERKKAEEEIKDLAKVVESSEDAIGTISLDGIITSWNKGAEKVYGYSTEEILGKHVSLLSPSHLDKETMKVIELIKQGESYHQYESLRIRKDENKIYVSITYSPVLDNNGKLVAISAIARDITRRKEAEEALAKIETARKQEIHHRIKNNLQVVSSLLDLQAEKFRNKEYIKESEILEAFRESKDRVISMALIHEELHKGGKVDTLNFSHYIKELADNLFLTYRFGNGSIGLNTDIEEDIFFDMDTAVPLGIIINELVSNSLKHAFTDRDKGKIHIKLHREKNGEYKNEGCNPAYVLTISDNGVGIPENLDIENLDSLGMQLVASLVDQLDGELELKRDNGTEFTIKFPVINNIEGFTNFQR